MAICKYRKCKKEFEPESKRQKYCTDECRIKENNLRQYEIKTGRRKRQYNPGVYKNVAHNPAMKEKRKKKMCHSCGKNPVGPGLYWLCVECYRQNNDITDEHSIYVDRVVA